MTAMAESSSIPLKSDKPVVVRVKRKAFQFPIDAFWLEISERPLKRPLLDFGKLSISDSSSSGVKELETKKILVQHVETVTSSKNSFDVLRSFVSNSSLALDLKKQNEEKRRVLKTVSKQDELLVKAKQRQEYLSRNARYEQIWRSRKAKKDALEDEALSEICRLYDVVRVDVEQEIEVKEKDIDLEDHMMMANYLPLLRETLPTAAVEIERDILDYMSKQVHKLCYQASSDDYVYDFYAVKPDAHVVEADSACQYPLVQVDDDDDYYDGPDYSEYGSDDSNGENNPLNDYPDEETSEDDDRVTSKSSDEKSEDESTTSDNPWEDLVRGSRVSYECEDSGSHHWLTDADQLIEDDEYSEGDDEIYENDFGDEEWN